MSATVVEIIQARASSDGDGVKLQRVFGGQRPERFDPFLLMDEFGSDEAADYIGGFPPHPHRGFETITIMLNGKMEHTDHLGNVGLLNDGDVQWMTAGSGVIHSEMPKQTEGLMRGFQLWLNLAAEDKMQTADYKDIPGDNLATLTQAGIFTRQIAGELSLNGEQISGNIHSGKTEAILSQIEIAQNTSLTLAIPASHNAMIYSYEGNATIGEKATKVPKGHLARLQHDGEIVLHNDSNEPVQLLFIAGKPLKEPIVQYGPFVMNTQEEIEEAITDYRKGVLTDRL